uniref:Uncharacterized protein n=1 Tax=Onchocerca volvulus TaxID=6282 RepID=A0A8R1XZ21_ONCVO
MHHTSIQQLQHRHHPNGLPMDIIIIIRMMFDGLPNLLIKYLEFIPAAAAVEHILQIHFHRLRYHNYSATVAFSSFLIPILAYTSWNGKRSAAIRLQQQQSTSPPYRTIEKCSSLVSGLYDMVVK